MSRVAKKRVQPTGADWIRQQDVPDEFFGGCARSTFWKIRRQPGFPRARRVTDGLILYRRSELSAFIDSCAT